MLSNGTSPYLIHFTQPVTSGNPAMSSLRSEPDARPNAKTMILGFPNQSIRQSPKSQACLRTRISEKTVLSLNRMRLLSTALLGNGGHGHLPVCMDETIHATVVGAAFPRPPCQGPIAVTPHNATAELARNIRIERAEHLRLCPMCNAVDQAFRKQTIEIQCVKGLRNTCTGFSQLSALDITQHLFFQSFK